MKYANSSEVFAKWSPVIESTTGISDKSKLEWMSSYCQNHELYEAGFINESNSLAVLGAVNGMGATRFPDSPGVAGFDFRGQTRGSGDKAHSLLPLAMQVAAQTVGLDLVPVVPMPGPMGMLTYLDFVYGGGKIDGLSGDVPLLVKAGGTNATIGTTGATFTYVGASRIDGQSVFSVTTDAGYPSGATSLQDLYDTALGATGSALSLVKALEDHVTGFSGSSMTNNQPYSREVGEITQDNVMNLTLCNKSVEAKTFQVAAAVTREQVQDLKQFGIDAVAQVESVLINELTQSINKHILDSLFELGDINHANIISTQGVNFFLNIGATAVTLTGAGLASLFSAVPAATTMAASENASSPAENLHTRQRKIMSKVLAIQNIISIRGRRGRGTFAVCSGQVASALQDCAGFIAAPMANAINQQGGLYPVGTLQGLAIYVDPNMSWSDTRILVGRKGDGNSPGLVFMPYLMAESVQTIAEGTMAPKVAVKSRYALVEAGHYPETMYLTTAVYVHPDLGGTLV